MKLITSEEILRKFIPNVLVSVKGETPFIDKLAPYLDLAEEWVKVTFTSESTFNTICGYADSNVIRTYTCKVVVCEAFRNAIPSLDLVLTPNGFGIVSNQNIAPASKERVERLIDSLESERDNAIRLLIPSLCGASEWNNTPQHEFFCSTLFPNIDLCDNLGIREHRWEKYLAARSALIDIEQHVIAEYIGQEQMDVFRKEAMSPSSTSSYFQKAVLRSLRAEVAQALRQQMAQTASTEPHICRVPGLVHVVNIIREHPDEFPEWHSADIAKLYQPKVFENKKLDKGFWF